MERRIEDCTEGRDPVAVALLHRFREAILALGEVEERVHGAEVAWARARVFASAFIHLRQREVDHPQLREAFATTKRVITHRLALGEPAQIDDELRRLLAEAYETVGPGTR